MRRIATIATTVLLLAAGAASAETPRIEFGRYKPLYPGLYGDFGVAREDGDEVFDANGNEQDSALPGVSGASRFPRDTLSAGFRWYFPMFEEEQLPFFSKRLHTARLRTSYARAEAEGRIASFADSRGLETDSSGLGDLTLEFGSFLTGSEGWRENKTHSFALLLLVGLNAATGRYDTDAANNPASNEQSLHLQLGAHWQPADGWLVDAGVTLREFDENEEPAFGALDPAQRGDDTVLDLSVARRLGERLFVSAFYYDRDGDANEYRNPRFVLNPPAPAAGMQTFPTPGVYRDGGTSLQAVGLTVSYFVAQNWLLALQAFHPTDGESGEFVLPFSQQPSSCTILNNCNPQPSGQRRRVDGLGNARSYANTSFMLTLTHSFGRSDPWL